MKTSITLKLSGLCRSRALWTLSQWKRFAAPKDDHPAGRSNAAHPHHPPPPCQSFAPLAWKKLVLPVLTADKEVAMTCPAPSCPNLRSLFGARFKVKVQHEESHPATARADDPWLMERPHRRLVRRPSPRVYAYARTESPKAARHRGRPHGAGRFRWWPSRRVSWSSGA